MNLLTAKRNLLARIAQLEAENAELKEKARHYDVILEAKRDWNAKRRKLFAYVAYRNHYGTPPRLWPETLCYECAHVKPDGSKAQDKFKCSQLGTRVGKYSSCDWAKKQRSP